MSNAADYSTAVVILQAGHHGGLGIARSLGRLGVPVYAIGESRWEPAFVSRYCRGHFCVNGDRSVGRILEIGRKVGGRPILLPTTDESCLWVASHAAALSTAFRFPVQDAALVETLSDKGRMSELARANGVPTPQLVVPRSKDDLARFLETATFPVVVKETSGGRLRSVAGASKFIVQTARELAELYAKAADVESPRMIVQEFIPGEDWMFDGYFDDNSRCLFGLSGKKIRRFPAETGVTSLGICLANESVIRTTTGFMRAIGYRGILDIGYRRDRRDGQYKVLDVNPRIGCTFRLFASANNLDVARVLYLDLTGQPVPPAAIPPARKWLVEDFDLFSAFAAWRAGKLHFKQWTRSLAGVQETACFAIDDPLPFLMMPAADCHELFRWACNRASIGEPLPQRANAVSMQAPQTAVDHLQRR
jgi:D-aspartate ligase